MSHCQLNHDGTFWREIFGGVRSWDANNYCSVDALVADGKAERFRIAPLIPTPPPDIDHATQFVERDGCEKVDGEWRYKWRVTDLSAQEIAAKEAAAAAALAEAAAHAKAIADAATARQDAKLAALSRMTPSEVRSYVAANVSNLADAKDVIATLAVAVSILSRKL